MQTEEDKVKYVKNIALRIVKLRQIVADHLYKPKEGTGSNEDGLLPHYIQGPERANDTLRIHLLNSFAMLNPCPQTVIDLAKEVWLCSRFNFQSDCLDEVLAWMVKEHNNFLETRGEIFTEDRSLKKY